MAIHAAQAKQDMKHKTSSCPKCHSLHLKKAEQARSNEHKTCMHHPCLDKTISGHETLQTMEINIMQRKYKRQLNPTSKQDGQFMAIHAAQAKQDMNHKTSSCPKFHSLHLKKGRASQIKQAQNVHAPSVSWQNHTWEWDCANNGNQYNAKKIQRKIQKGSSTDLKTRWTIHSRSTGKTGHEPQDLFLPKVPLPASKKRQNEPDQTSTKRACTIRVLTKPYLGIRLCKQWKSI